ncbi:YraN family protein [Vibrio sp. IRLE0018]|uniref:YraN family protein n=1 Tax=Vibrio TaxID=662 RepID=UPI0015947434|nr:MULTISPECIES: YraN family protein [Vibrio]MCF8779828.1 YraN family protein [Vibrio floridensis]NVC63448.1 YraN family protein [Vibrio sp. 05-20-BW147]HAS6348233.1 YraN family protein [Vibrio vulnificus]
MGLFSRRAIGNQYESLAKEYLQRQGLRFIEANFSTKVGEIDLIFKEAQTIVFVEVKYRKNSFYGNAAEMVSRAKANKMIKTAYLWLAKHGYNACNTAVRFDVVAIHEHGKDINWIANAITQG